MIVCSIGDVHGSSDWKNAKQDVDLIVFLGDYVDSNEKMPRHYTSKEILNNLLEIIEFKKSNPDKVKLLIGNHDVQYFLFDTELADAVKTNGYKNTDAWELNKIFTENKDLFQMCFQHDNYLWTHAGVTIGAWKNYYEEKSLRYNSLEEMFNDLWERRDLSLFHVGKIRKGFSPYGSIIWADTKEITKGILPNYHQIVGHNRVPDLVNAEQDFDTTIVLCDVLDTKPNTFYYNEI